MTFMEGSSSRKMTRPLTCYGPEAFRMILMQVLGHLGQVVTPGGQVFGTAFLYGGARFGNVEIRDLPVLDQAAELGHDPEFLELAQPLDGKHFRFVQCKFGEPYSVPGKGWSLHVAGCGAGRDGAFVVLKQR